MTGNIVKLVFESIAQGSGFAKVSAETSALRKNLGFASGAVAKLSQAFGNMGNLIGGSLSAILRGNFWEIGARACGFLVDKIKDHNRLMKDAALAARGLSREYMTLEYAAAQYRKRVEEWHKAKEASDKAEADAAEKRKEAAEAEKRQERERLSFEQKYYNLEQQIAEEIRKRESLDADELTKLKLKIELMRKIADENVRQAKRNLASAKENGNGYDQDTAEKELMLAKERQKTVDVEARKLVDAYSKAKDAALKKAAAARDAEEKAAREAEKEKKRAEIEQKREEAELRHKKEVAAIEKEISAAKERAAKLEENALRARGKSADDWLAGERDLAREKRSDITAKRVARSERELENLEAMNPRAMSKWQRNRLAKLREWKADQDPNNNPELKAAKNLEQKREQMIAEQLKELKEINANLKAATQL